MLQQKKKEQLVTCHVLRSFWYKGEATVVGENIDLPKRFAGEMEAASKVSIGAQSVKIEGKAKGKKTIDPV